jgi:hypothetical protein
MEVKLGKKVFIRDAGKDESWLQGMICENLSILELGDFLTIGERDKRETPDGRFHITLNDFIIDIQYEMEVMLGEIDASHIITSLEYWNNEEWKRHRMCNIAVLVAESFEGRYFNLLQTLCMKLPMICIQANLLEVNEEYVLSFSKIPNLYLRPNDSEKVAMGDESVWSDKSPWTLKAAKELYRLIDADDKSIEYRENYINVCVQGRRAFRLERSSDPASVVFFTVFDEKKVAAIKDVFYNKNFPPSYNFNREKEFVFAVDEDMIRSKEAIFQEILKIRYTELLSHR